MDLVDIARFILSFVVVIGLIGGLAWVLRRYGAGRIATAGGRKGRLGVVEVAIIDARRRLVLVRRDDVEHLLLLSATGETVVETGIGASDGGTRFADRLAAAQSTGEPPAAPPATDPSGA